MGEKTLYAGEHSKGAVPEKQELPEKQAKLPKHDTKDAPGKGKAFSVFIVLFVALCLLPFVGMLWANSTSSPTLQDTTLPQPPAFTNEDDTPNLNYFSNLGEYFEDHFAYRSVAIDLNARIRADLFKTSPTWQVIVGTDGWLYYGGTLEDYLANNPLTNREARAIAHNLSLMQGYTEAMGAEFIFTIAPNKNSLYPQHMPYYYPSGNNESMTLLKGYLAREGITYVDLFAAFEATSGELYARTDTHWTAEGALLAANELLLAAGKDAATPLANPETATTTGDIERMLYPLSASSETSQIPETGSWQYAGKAQSVEDDLIDTTSPDGEDTLLMYRDSFANTLIPYLAPEFAEAQFTKFIPYNLTEVASLEVGVVVVERAERQVRLLCEDPPFMYAPTREELEVGEQLEAESWVSWHQDGDFRVLEGSVSAGSLGEEDEIFLVVEGSGGVQQTYVPFYLSDSSEPTEYGFKLFLNESSLTDGDYTISVVVLKAEEDEACVATTVTLEK